jgi:catechol 2,3-dioxygenase-like lactoylglutathione lyase family enzyme
MIRKLITPLVLLLSVVVTANIGLAEEEVVDSTKPAINVRFVMNYCSDLKATRHFYTDLVGLSELSYIYEEDWQWLNYKCDGLEFIFFEDKSLPVVSEFSEQPGWDGGTLHRTSWSIQVPLEQLAATVKRLREAGVTAKFEKPQWQQDSYWSYPVLDPSGNTVELYSTVKERPASTEWAE